MSAGRVILDWQYASARLMSVPPPSWTPNSTSTGSASCSVRSTTAVSKTTSRVRSEDIEASTAPKTEECTTEAAIEPDWSMHRMTSFRTALAARA